MIWADSTCRSLSMVRSARRIVLELAIILRVPLEFDGCFDWPRRRPLGDFNVPLKGREAPIRNGDERGSGRFLGLLRNDPGLRLEP